MNVRRLLTCALAVLLLAACGGGEAGTTETAADTTAGGVETAAEATPAEGGDEALTIAFLMPCSTCADRFENQDKPLFIEAVAAIDPAIEVIANNAQGESADQVAQAEAALSNGADVIVISPLDEAAGAAISDRAAQDGVPVLSYDGLITGAATDFYVSFDNEAVGRVQGEYLAEQLPEGSNVVIINGDQTIAPGRQFKAGAHAALDPLFESGQLTLAFEADTAQFDPATGQASMEQALTTLGDDVDAVLVPNDGLAGAVVNALTPRGLVGQVLVTGQDATDAGLQRILLDQQTMTVYKAIKAEAEAAAEVAVALGRGEDVAELATTTVDNDNGEVPAILLESVVVTKDNIDDTVFADAFTTPENVCTGEVPAEACE